MSEPAADSRKHANRDKLADRGAHGAWVRTSPAPLAAGHEPTGQPCGRPGQTRQIRRPVLLSPDRPQTKGQCHADERGHGGRTLPSEREDRRQHPQHEHREQQPDHAGLGGPGQVDRPGRVRTPTESRVPVGQDEPGQPRDQGIILFGLHVPVSGMPGTQGRTRDAKPPEQGDSGQLETDHHTFRTQARHQVSIPSRESNLHGRQDD